MRDMNMRQAASTVAHLHELFTYVVVYVVVCVVFVIVVVVLQAHSKLLSSVANTSLIV